MRMDRRIIWGAAVAIGTGCGPTPDVASPNAAAPPDASIDGGAGDRHDGHGAEATTLYVWGSDQAGIAPDFLAVIDFDRRSRTYGKVLRTVPLPPPGNIGNEPHHCHTSVDQTILACGGLLSVLKGQNDIFFFDISNARNPKFLFSTRAPNSSITDDFLPLPGGGFLVTNMGSATGGAGGRVVEFDKRLRLVAEYPATSPPDGGFNPHGIDADFRRNLLVTSDFINPVTTLNAFAGDVQLRSSLRFWDLRKRQITRTVVLPDQAGTMDVKLIPGDSHGRAITSNMFTGLVYTVDPTDGSYVQAFDCATITPHVDVPVRGGMTQLLAMPRNGRRLIFGLFQAGQVGMLDITNPNEFKQVSVVSFGKDSGPHSVHLTHDDKRLVVTDYFLNEDDFGKIHFEGDHKVRVLNVRDDGLSVDPAFQVVDFNTAFPTGPARPHGIGMK
ncbi:MAG TPA: selenium-binding protein SBP56-related protein [Gemmatimonadaceae bacterium]|nr:selenium-binding protein SBP56-related protein [Gemmatimonadaceae bacterium]